MILFPMVLGQSDIIFWTAFTGIISALATGLGAIPVHFVHKKSKVVRAFSSAAAAGMMISASVFSLAQEGIALKDKFPLSPYIVILGLLLGASFFRYTEKNFSDPHVYQNFLGKNFTKRGLLIFIAMFIHSIPEGIAIGVAFATGNFHFGLIMAIAITVHNIPEGIAVSLPLRAKGVSTLKCAGWAIFTSVPQPVFAVPAFLLVSLFHPLLPFGLGFAGGAMMFLVASELMPESIATCSRSETAWGFMIGLVLMLLFTSGLGL